MDVFLFILGNNIVPIFLLIGIGYLLSKKFDLNIYTLTKLNFYIFVPSFIFVNLYTTEIDLDLLKALFFAIILLFVNMALGTIVAKIKGFKKAEENAFKNALMFYNSGNIGIPLITLVFSTGPYLLSNGETPYLTLAVATQIMVLVVQNITTNTIGFFNAGKANMHWMDSIKKILTMPTIYAIPLALILKAMPYDFTQFPGYPAVVYAKNGLIAIALISLGVQLSKTAISFKNKDVYLVVAIRLLGGPALAYLLILLMGFDGIVAQTLIISSSVPTAINTALIAVECDSSPEFASQIVMFATLLSAITLTFVIYLSRLLFPIL